MRSRFAARPNPNAKTRPEAIVAMSGVSCSGTLRSISFKVMAQTARPARVSAWSHPARDVLKHLTIRCSIVGTRKDLQETLALAARGLVKCNYTSARMEDINDVFDEMRAGKIDGRIVLEIGDRTRASSMERDKEI